METNKSTLNYTESSKFLEAKISDVIYIYISPCIIFIGTVANILSILVLSRKSMRRSTTMFYLLVLSSADLLVLYTGLLRHWIIKAFEIDLRLLSGFICKLHVFLVYFSLDFASWILVAVTVDRCVSVIMPLKVKLCCTNNASIITVVIIFFTVIFINSHLYFTVEMQIKDGRKVCQDTEVMSDFVNRIWPWVDFAVFCFVPFGIMIVANILIIRKVTTSVRSFRKMNISNGLRTSLYTRRISLGANVSSSSDQDKKISSISNTNEKKSMEETNKNNLTKSHVSMVTTNVTIMLLSVNAVFLLCTTPIAVYFIGRHYWENDQILTPHEAAQLDLLYCIANMLQYLNNCIHFFLYCFTGKRFRAEFYKLFAKKSGSRKFITQ